MKKIITICAIVVISFAAFIGYNFLKKGTSSAYQHDADIIRLNDLKIIAGYLQEYYENNQTYPLIGASEVPIYVYIATKNQQKYIKGGPNTPHTVVPVVTFIEELEKGIGRKIELPFDPQKVPDKKPNFYIYMVSGQTYNIAIHLHQEFEFTRKITNGYNKVEVSNNPNPAHAIWSPKELFSNQNFINAASTKVNKPGYFEHMRREIRKKGAF